MRIIYAIIVIAAVFSACRKKELPSEVPAEPDFYVDCNIDGKKVLMEAGNEGYYMNAACYLDTTHRYVYKADLSQSCNAGCGYAITVLINDYKTSSYGAPMNPDSALRPGIYPYNDREMPSETYLVKFTPEVAQSSSNSYTWVIKSGSAPVLEQKSYDINTSLKAGSVYSVTLFTEDNSGCFTEHSMVYDVGNPLQGNISASRISNTELKYTFWADLTNIPGITYEWSFGDGSKSTEAGPTKVFDMKPGYHNVTLRAITPAGDTCVLNYQVPGTLDYICGANFKTVLTAIPRTTSASRVTIILKDPAGTEFTTRGFEQPDVSSFVIDELSSYDHNSRNEPTKRLKVRFNCVLREGTREIQLTNGSALIGVAYK
jgi:hypothetical protein